jgi:transposase InsO family protein
MTDLTNELGPRDRAEAVALFRAQLIAPLVCRTLTRGERAAELRRIADERWRPPGSQTTRRYAVPTLERWLYSFRKGGVEALRPRPRSDRGAAQALSAEERELVLAIRREHPRASVPVIVRTLEADGRLARGKVSEPTLRRLFVEHGLDRATLARAEGPARLRWQAATVDELWHADVCHGPSLTVGERSVPLRIHAMLDDHSRYIIAIQACATERESEMLSLLVKAVRLHGVPTTLYLDNGPTYSGQALSTACARLGIALVHAKPYDPQARGKMERLWRTLREQCLDHLGSLSSLHEVQVRLLAWVDRHYHRAAHAGLMGKCPAEVYERGRSNAPDELTETHLRDALTVRQRRRVRRDGTVSVGGIDWELSAGFLAGRIVTVARTLVDSTSSPWVEHEDQRLGLHRVDIVANARRARRRLVHTQRRGIDAVDFDPPGALLDEALSRRARDGRKDGAQ